jgi:hypothetical protein
MTAQAAGDIYVYGEKFGMLSLPGWPDGHERIEPRSEKAARQSLDIYGRTSCRRNYIGSWEILYGKLYLKSIAGAYKLTQETPLLASWFSGTLRVATGDCVDYIHGGFLSKFSQEHFYEIDAGRVVKSWVVENKKFQL